MISSWFSRPSRVQPKASSRAKRHVLSDNQLRDSRHDHSSCSDSTPCSLLQQSPWFGEADIGHALIRLLSPCQEWKAQSPTMNFRNRNKQWRLIGSEMRTSSSSVMISTAAQRSFSEGVMASTYWFYLKKALPRDTTTTSKLLLPRSRNFSQQAWSRMCTISAKAWRS